MVDHVFWGWSHAHGNAPQEIGPPTRRAPAGGAADLGWPRAGPAAAGPARFAVVSAATSMISSAASQIAAIGM